MKEVYEVVIVTVQAESMEAVEKNQYVIVGYIERKGTIII